MFQACSRGALRLCDGDQAHECAVYIMAAKNTKIKSALSDMFPGCTVRTWNKDGTVRAGASAHASGTSRRAREAWTLVGEAIARGAL